MVLPLGAAVEFSFFFPSVFLFGAAVVFFFFFASGCLSGAVGVLSFLFSPVCLWADLEDDSLFFFKMASMAFFVLTN